MLIGSMECHQLAFSWLPNQSLIFDFVFIAGSTISQSLFEKLLAVMKNSENFYITEFLANVTKLVNIANMHTHWRSSTNQGTTIT